MWCKGTSFEGMTVGGRWLGVSVGGWWFVVLVCREEARVCRCPRGSSDDPPDRSTRYRHRRSGSRSPAVDGLLLFLSRSFLLSCLRPPCDRLSSCSSSMFPAARSAFRVPEDCLTKVVGEFLECPQLGFVQCRTTPLRAEDNYWEVGLAR